MQSKRSAPKVAFGALVESGYLTPGVKLTAKKGQISAIVRADGSLQSDAEIGSIHGLGAKLQNAPSCNGWTFWHVEHEGEVKPIDALRQLYLLAVED
jgi:modification methylase